MWGSGAASRHPVAADRAVVHAAQRPVKSSLIRSNGSVKRGAPSDQHVVVARPHPVGGDSRTTSRSRRRTRLRSTASPTFFEHGEPDAHRSVLAPRSRACSTNADDGGLGAGRGGQKVRALPQPLHGDAARFRTASGAQPLAAARAPGGRRPCGRPWSSCGRDSRDGACAPACWVDRSASRDWSPFAVACGLIRRPAQGRQMRRRARSAPITISPQISVRWLRRGGCLVYRSAGAVPPHRNWLSFVHESPL